MAQPRRKSVLRQCTESSRVSACHISNVNFSANNCLIVGYWNIIKTYLVHLQYVSPFHLLHFLIPHIVAEACGNHLKACAEKYGNMNSQDTNKHTIFLNRTLFNRNEIINKAKHDDNRVRPNNTSCLSYALSFFLMR